MKGLTNYRSWAMAVLVSASFIAAASGITMWLIGPDTATLFPPPVRTPHALPISHFRRPVAKPEIKHSIHLQMKKRLPVRVSQREREDNDAPLNSMRRNYHYHLNGKTLCAGNPCSTALRVVLESDGEELVADVTALSAADGTFLLDIPFQGQINRQLDLKLMAAADMMEGEVRLHHILTEETAFTLSRNVELH